MAAATGGLLTKPTKQLSASAISVLDLVRASAALYVVAHHVAQARGLSGLAYLPFSFGQEAVVVFFLLSGALISVKEGDRVASDLSGYAWRRVRRIYPPLVIAMLLSVGLARLGWIDASASWTSAIANLLGLQDLAALKPGVIAEPFMGNAPLWSLSYELFFYAAFPAIAWLVRRLGFRTTTTCITALSTVALGAYWWSPGHWSLLVAYLWVWWAGAVAAHAWSLGELSVRGVRWYLPQVLVPVAVAIGMVFTEGWVSAGVFPVLLLRHFGIAGALVVGAMSRALRAAASTLARRSGAFPGVLSSVSYGIYVFHYPLVIQTGATESISYLVLALAALGVLSWVADARLLRWLRRGALPR